jgi:aromatic-L-amino-acid decarboxylase
MIRKDESAPLGDMSAEEFRRSGHQLIDWIADYLNEMERYPVLSRCRPGDVRRQIPGAPPAQAESMDRILADIDRVILPGITHWNHPSFHSYFSITGSGPGILGELVSAALNVNGMLWRTSPAATELEEAVLDWLRQMLGLPEQFWGIIYDTASISTFHALAAARQSLQGWDSRKLGLCGMNRRLRAYASEQAHSSVEKAALALGIGLEGVRKIGVDNEFRMRPDLLHQAIEDDLRAGWWPFCVTATVGTTSTTSVDPVAEIAPICRKFGLWLHVDGAYGGPAAVVPELKWVLDGCEAADSIVVNPHKWLFTPIDCSVFYCSRPEVLREAFSLVPEYLKSSESATNFMDYGIQLGRRFRALKLWMVIRYFGVAGIAARIRAHVSWASELAGWIDDDPEFERLAPVPFSTVCFRAVPKGLDGQPSEVVDRFNEDLIEAINRQGEIFVSHTRLRGRFTIRLAIGNIKTTRAHIVKAWEVIRRQCSRLLEERG